jgi:Fe-S oxidoreductase
MSLKPLVFSVLFLLANALFAWSAYRYYRYISFGPKEDRFDRIGERILSVLIFFIGQRKVAEKTISNKSRSLHHLLIFWGFLVITAGSVEIMISGVWPLFSMEMVVGEMAYRGLRTTIDLFNLVVLAMVAYGFVRRIVIQPKFIPLSGDATIILGAIGGLMITHFLHHAPRIAETGAEPWMPVSNLLAGVFPHSGMHVFEQAMWWTHATILLAFLNYLPYSKHMHILGALPNIFFRKLGPTEDPDVPPASVHAAMSKLDLEAAVDRFGAGMVEDFSWKQLLDSYACTECARCSLGCPATSTGKVLSPFHIILGLKSATVERGTQLLAWESENRAHLAKETAAAQARGESDFVATPLPKPEPKRALVGDVIAEQALWDCTTCGQCMQVCPVFIEHVPKILDMRRHLVLDQGKMPAELARTLKNLENQGNPWGMNPDKRMDWAEGLKVQTIEQLGEHKPEYLFWVGCAGAFDERIKQVTRSTVKVLNAAGVDFAVLGTEEKCTGDTARRAGQEYLFQMMAQDAVDTLNNTGVKKVVTACPHCFNTIKNEYPQFGGKYEVMHHSQLISSLIGEGKLRPGATSAGRNVAPGPAAGKNGHGAVLKDLVYHDSCYLGRWNGEYDAPRHALDAVPRTGQFHEVRQSKRDSLCCGAGGARMWMEEHDGARINRTRTKQLLETGAQTIATACPFCLTMVDDGVKDAGKEEQVQVLDVAEVVARSVE